MEPIVAKQTTTDRRLIFSKLIYIHGGLYKLSVQGFTAPATLLIEAVGKFTPPMSFLLYNNGSHKQTISLKGSQKGAFESIETGSVEIQANQSPVFSFYLEEENPLE